MILSEQWIEIVNPCLSFSLLVIGLICLMTRKRVIKQVIGVSIMLQGALFSLIDAGRVTGDMAMAQSMLVSALIVEGVIIAIALSLVVNVYRYHPEGWIDDMNSLKG